MKKTSFIAAALSAIMIVSPVFAGETKNIDKEFSLTTDFAFYPQSDFIKGETHFAPLTGFYSGLEGRVTAEYEITIPTPLGSNWLVSGANLKLTSSFELSPVSVRPGMDITFTPVPFLVFSAGAMAGTGWNLGGLQGMGAWDDLNQEYVNLTPFSAWFLKAYAQGTFQFDLGAVVPGDWTHVQFMYTYQVYWHSLTGVEDGDLWIWQCSGKRANGLQNYQNLVLAYGIPNDVVKRVGVLWELDGFYSDSAFNTTKYHNYNSTFKSISISPLVQFEFGKHDALSVLLGFSSRRSFTTSHENGDVEPYLIYAGYEWYFNRLALSWKHTF